MNHDLPWRKSRDCADGQCVEVAIIDDTVLVRNSDRPDDVVRFTAAEWRAFLSGVGRGQFHT